MRIPTILSCLLILSLYGCAENKQKLSPIAQACQNNAECDDNNACTIDVCANGVCDYGYILCEDEDPCTIDEICDPETGCVFPPVVCAPWEVCEDGECKRIQFPSAASSCQTNEECDDNNVCTVDVCDEGNCDYGYIFCTDGDPCTVDGVCDPQDGCSFPPINCHPWEVCVEGECQTIRWPAP